MDDGGGLLNGGTVMGPGVLAVVLSLTGFVPGQGGQSSPGAAQESPARPLEGSAFICSGEAVAGGGFQIDKVSRKMAPLASGASEKSAVTSIIRVQGSGADLFPVAGARNAPGPVGRFEVHKTDSAVALWQRDGLASHVVTIDLRNSTFVYSSQAVSDLANKVEVFSGSCRPYV